MRPWQVERACEHCGQNFAAAKRDVAKGWGRFCSRKCKAAVTNQPGPTAPHWKTGRQVTKAGYVNVATGVNRGGSEHVAIAERVLGRPLPAGAEVHHFNEIKSDNRPQNLVICQDAAYHKYLHALQRVRRLGGRAFLDSFCSTCKTIKPKTAFSPREHRCKTCNAARVAAAKSLQRRSA